MFVGGVHVGGPFAVHKGETVNLGIVRNFTGSTSVQLREVDSNSAEDNLGLRAVLDNSVTHGNLIFDAAKKAYCAVNSTGGRVTGSHRQPSRVGRVHSRGGARPIGAGGPGGREPRWLVSNGCFWVTGVVDVRPGPPSADRGEIGAPARE